jgi:hypothetical protein
MCGIYSQLETCTAVMAGTSLAKVFFKNNFMVIQCDKNMA